MNLVLNQLISAYESCPGGQETVDMLAAQFNLEPAIVSTLLHTHSSLFRVKQDMMRDGVGALAETPVEDISDAEFDLIKESVKSIGMSSPDERLRAKVGMWLWDEKKGRNAKKDINFANVNVTTINNHFAALREAKAARRAALTNKVVDVET